MQLTLMRRPTISLTSRTSPPINPDNSMLSFNACPNLALDEREVDMRLFDGTWIICLAHIENSGHKNILHMAYDFPW